ncbi:hypothetical protein ACJX0J_018227, partial [Zea mays]
HGESSSHPHPNYYNFGINENEDCSLLFEEEPCIYIRNYTAYQGLERLLGALSAHMWPGIILKSRNRITTPFLVEKQ